MANKKPKKRPRRIKKKTRKKSGLSLRSKIIITSLIVIFGITFHYRNGIRWWTISQYERWFKHVNEDKPDVNDIRNIEVMSRHREYLFGFDVSHYQEKIDWHSIDSVYQQFPLDFVFLRATMGVDGVDKNYRTEWKKAKSRLLVRGAYHFYRPDENSLLQAQNFIRNVQLEPGDLAPVLDIETYPTNQSVDSLKIGLQKWLDTVEKHYNVKPIIYSGEHFYNELLKDDFSDYPIWIANYNFFVENIKDNWTFWQFTDKGSMPEISSRIDLNIFRGNRYELKKYLVR